MYRKKWRSLRKLDDSFELEPELVNKTHCPTRINFNHLSFDCNEETLITVDSLGFLYLIDLLNNVPCYQKLINIGQVTFVAFNPINKLEILIGLTNSDIKILRINENISEFCLLIAHKVPPTHISFYKQFCLTSSCNEVIIWCLRSCSKTQQLRVSARNVIIKKASFSNCGDIVVLYYNDTLQAWRWNRLEDDIKIYAKKLGIRNIKDFVFTQNSRAMIMSAANKIVILNTCDWGLIKVLNLPDDSIEVKQLLLVPTPLDGGANHILACLSSSQIRFFDLNQSCIVNTLKPLKAIRKFAVSQSGRFVAYTEKEGSLKLLIAEKLLKERGTQQKVKEISRPAAHGISEHLACIKQNLGLELRLERLIPILKEFGEYPEKYRMLIWSTILNLPGNRKAYNALVNNAASSSFNIEALRNYPLANRSQRILLTTIVNTLVQFCPLLAQCSFLANLIFPFLTVFQKNLLLGFEFLLSFLLNYCQKWFEYHPLPPLNVLGIAENILLHVDPALLKVFCERKITSSEYVWPLLRTAMSEVLSASEWLILWDHLVSFKKPSLLLMAVIAYSVCSREIIISTLHSAEDIKKYFTSQGHLTARELIKVAQRIDCDVPLRIHPSRYLRNELIPLPEKGPYPPFMLQDFPRFLTDEISIPELQKLKQKARIAKENERKTVAISEAKRLKQEANSFMEQIHRSRLNQVQKCIEQLSDMNLRLEEENIGRQRICDPICKFGNLYTVPELDLSTSDANEEAKDCEILQRDVDKLECEVQSFLTSLRSNKSSIETV